MWVHCYFRKREFRFEIIAKQNKMCLDFSECTVYIYNALPDCRLFEINNHSTYSASLFSKASLSKKERLDFLFCCWKVYKFKPLPIILCNVIMNNVYD